MSDEVSTRTEEQCVTVECPFWEGDGCACDGVTDRVRNEALAKEWGMFGGN